MLEGLGKLLTTSCMSRRQNNQIVKDVKVNDIISISGVARGLLQGFRQPPSAKALVIISREMRF